MLRAGQRPGQAAARLPAAATFPSAAALAKIRRAVDEAQHGLGVALLKGLPREGVTPDEFELLTWAVGLHVGVARPQDKMTRYINRVQDVGTVYRSPAAAAIRRMPSSTSTSTAPTSCCSAATTRRPSGGDSMCASSIAACRQLASRAARPGRGPVRAASPSAARTSRPTAWPPSRQMPVHRRRGRRGVLHVGPQPRRATARSCRARRASREAARGDGPARRDRAAARLHVLDAARAGRPADPQQLHGAAFAHPVPGRPRAREEAAAVSACGWPRPIRRACRPAGMASTNPPNPAWCGAAPTGSTTTTQCRRFDAEQAQAMGMRLGPGFSN